MANAPRRQAEEMKRRTGAAGLLLALFLGGAHSGWTQDTPAARGEDPGNVAETTDAEVEKLVAEAESMLEAVYTANRHCRLEERMAPARRISEIYKALDSMHMAHRVYGILNDKAITQFPKGCEYLVTGPKKTSDYTSPDQRAHTPMQEESYSAFADRLHLEVSAAVKACNLERAKNALSDLNSLSYDVGRLRASYREAPPEVDRQVQAAIEHIQKRATAAWYLLDNNRERCKQVVTEREAEMDAASAAHILELIEQVEATLAEAEAAKSRLDCGTFEKAVEVMQVHNYELIFGLNYLAELPGNLKGYIDRHELLFSWNCQEAREKAVKEDILSDIDEAAEAPAEQGSPWDKPNPDSPWDKGAAPTETAAAGPLSPASGERESRPDAARAGSTVALDWQQDDYGLREVDIFICPPNPERRFSATGLIGTNRYMSKSPVCVAAAHAGVIAAERGGSFRLKFFAEKPEDGYKGTERNGITSGSWDREWAGFSFLPAE